MKEHVFKNKPKISLEWVATTYIALSARVKITKFVWQFTVLVPVDDPSFTRGSRPASALSRENCTARQWLLMSRCRYMTRPSHVAQDRRLLYLVNTALHDSDYWCHGAGRWSVLHTWLKTGLCFISWKVHCTAVTVDVTVPVDDPSFTRGSRPASALSRENCTARQWLLISRRR